MGITEIDPCTFGLALSPLEYILPKCRNTYTKKYVKRVHCSIVYNGWTLNTSETLATSTG